MASTRTKHKTKKTAARGAMGSKRTTAAAKRTTRAIKKTARAAKASPIGKAAAKVLAGAAAGAVRAIIPQLEEAAAAQEKVGNTRNKGTASKSAKTAKSQIK